MINYLPKYEDLMNIAYSFCENFGYTIESQSYEIEGMGCAFINLEKEGYPNLRIEMERYVLICFINFSEDISLSFLGLYKYLKPKNILRNNLFYRSKKNFKKFYIEDQCKYLKEILKYKDKFNYEDFQSFYEKYPFDVWKWIEK